MRLLCDSRVDSSAAYLQACRTHCQTLQALADVEHEQVPASDLTCENFQARSYFLCMTMSPPQA